MSVGADLPIGSELAGYRVDSMLGRGGMGVVYKAHDLALDRPVALKILAPELAADEAFRSRFLRESRLAASIDHPNVIPVYDAGEFSGELYIAMRFVDGSDLRRMISAGPLTKEQTIGVVSQIAAALDTAHARGLVHRDVKPSNVLVGEGEHAYLADFGLTRQLGEAVAVVGATQSLGTADYVSPEQIRGNEVDGRSDLYSLGCLLHECLTGAPPFHRDSALGTLFAHLEEKPPSAPGLEHVMSTALAKDPDDRYQSGRELVEAARAALGLEPKRTRWPQALAGVGLLLLGAALLAFFLTRGNGGAGAEPGADSLVRIDPKTNTVARTMPVGRQTSGVAVSGRRVWVANAGDGTLWRIDPGTSKVLKIPVHATPTGVAAAGPYVVVANGPEGTATGFDAATGENLGAATLSLPDFQTILVAGGEGRIWYAVPAKQMAGDAAGDILPTATPSGDVHIPPDETDLLSAYTSFDGLAVGEGSIWLAGDAFGRTVWRVDPGSRQVIATIPLPFIPAGIAAGENGVWITSLLDDTVSRLDPRTGRITWTVRVGRGGYAVSAGEGGVWVASSIDGTVTRLDPGTGRVVAVIPTRRSPTAVAAGAGGVWVVEGT